MSEEINDPNQLDLFAGTVLTVEQQKLIDVFVNTQLKATMSKQSEIKTLENLLVEAGFIKGVHFENTFTPSLETREVRLGRSWEKTEFIVEVTAYFNKGNISLLGKRFDSVTKKVNEHKYSIDFEKDKVQSSSIQGQYRFVKPKTLLEKLTIHNERTEYEYKEFVRTNTILNKTILKYEILYPNATVIVGVEWTKNQGEYKTITIKFPSGSFIKFRLGYEIDGEYIIDKRDVEFQALTTSELLDKFSKQVKKEASN
jgi:hypothetical protein